MTIRFDGRVAIVTGAGNGLGRAHALGLASRGAKVVVNDFGGARDGTGASLSPAEAVVEDIRKAGGEAMADGADVSNYEQVKEMAAFALGRLAQVVMFLNKHVNLFDALCHKNNGCNLFA